MRDRRILVETNLTSNLQTHVVARPEEHPLRRYLDAGLVVSLSSDNWLMSGTTTTQEYWLAHGALRLTRQEIDQMILDGMAAAFLPWPERRSAARSDAGRAGGDRLMGRFTGLIGIALIVALGVALSRDRRAIRWSVVAWGLGLQLVFRAVRAASARGSGPLPRAGRRSDDAARLFLRRIRVRLRRARASSTRASGVILAFQILPAIIFVSALFAILYYLGVMQVVVRGVRGRDEPG